MKFQLINTIIADGIAGKWLFKVGWKKLASEVRRRLSSGEGKKDANTVSIKTSDKEVVREYLGFDVLPKEIKNRYLIAARQLKNQLRSRIKEYKDKASNAVNTSEGKMKSREYRYFADRNAELLKDLNVYLKCGIESDALNKMLPSVLGGWSISKLSILEMRSKSNMIESVDVLLNKFAKLPVNAYEKIRELYVKDRIGYVNAMRNLLITMKPLSIVKRMQQHHILCKRADIVKAGLDLYRQKKYQAAITVLAVQVEGLMFDCLVELEGNGRKYDSQPIAGKVIAMQNKFKDFLGFEYYNFVFPIVRNEVAHGNLLPSGELEECAINVILDVWGLCEYISDTDSLPINTAVRLLRDIIRSKADTVNYYVFEYNKHSRQFPDLVLPEMYNLNNGVEKIKRIVSRESFWKYLTQIIESRKDLEERLPVILYIAKKFHVAKLADCCRETCKRKIKEHEARTKAGIIKIRKLFMRD